ncbi:MAG: caspase family protein [Alphaproteobacteria bacterium]|nr:caspase family protein [Alphaproteobacteria bacterium]
MKRLLTVVAAVLSLVAVVAEADPLTNVLLNHVEARMAIHDQLGGISGVTVGDTGRFATVVLSDGSIRLWDLQFGVQRSATRPGRSAVAISDRTGVTFVGGGVDGVVRLFDGASGDERFRVGSLGGAIRALGRSADGRVVVTASGRVVQVWVLSEGRAESAAAFTGDVEISAVASSSDGTSVVAGDAVGTVRYWEVGSPRSVRVLGRLGGRVMNVGFVNGGIEVVAGSENGDAAVWRAATGEVLIPVRRLTPRASTMAISSSGSSVAIAEADTITVTNLVSGRQLSKMSIASGVVTGLGFDLTAEHLLSVGSDGKMRIWNVDTGEELLEISFTTLGWIAMDGRGRFDGNEDGIAKVGWLTGAGEIPLQQFSPNFFNSGLVRAYWQGEADGVRAVPEMAAKGKFSLPPVVEIDDVPSQQAAGHEQTLIVVATDQGGGVGPIRLYHNGKLVSDRTLVEQQDMTRDGKHLRAAAFRVMPTSGPNTFEGVATNTQGIEGRSRRSTVLFDGPVEPATVHVVAVGISRYSDPRLNLDYSVTDANAIVERIRNASASIGNAVRENILVDGGATTDGIRGAFARLNDVGGTDIVIIYLAGHGLATGGDWIFVPYEASVGKSEADFVGKYVTASELRDALVKIPAQRVFLMIDSCYSGAGVKLFERNQALQRGFLRDISRTAGITVLAAAQENQEAAELAGLGHGLFTYVVMSGLAGGARLPASPNGEKGPVTAHELVRFTNRQIATYADQLDGHAQEPMGYALGADFVLGK